MATTTTTKPVGITFEVDRVQPTKKRLGTIKTHQALRKVFTNLESCNDYHGEIVSGIYRHALLEAVHTAFSEHRPLTLSPDVIWITIAQGVAHHMAVHGEALRSRFVAHSGKLKLTFKTQGWVEGSPENPWHEAFESWTSQIREHVGETIHDALICDFSTSGPVERATSQIVMMDVFERFFHYAMVCICGIPTVTLEGTTDDWIRLRDKAEQLRPFEMDWWLDHLLPICDQFVRASQGDVDLKHWQSICKLEEAYGGDIINGWIAKLFPYLRSFPNGPCNHVNPIFETGDGFSTLRAPSGFSQVPFVWSNLQSGTQRQMEAIGGLTGIEQDPDTLGLRAKVGWAIRVSDRFEAVLSQLKRNHRTVEGVSNLSRDERGWMTESGYPMDFDQFYFETNGAVLCAGDDERLTIIPKESIEALDWGEDSNRDDGSFGPHGRIWHKFAVTADGDWLAINLDVNLDHAPCFEIQDLQEKMDALDYRFQAPICVTSQTTVNQPGENAVIALSFQEFLRRSLDDPGILYWHDPEFTPYGDAELFTRRNKRTK